MIFPKEFITQVKDRVLASQIVGKRVALKHKGKEFSGLCPFHTEKTPSFTVNDDKGFYHCFGCGAHGNVFDFLMQMEGATFPEAVEQLANLAGMTLPKRDERLLKEYDQHAKLMQCAEAAARYFQENLKNSFGAEARDYLRNRALGSQVIEEFRLGFAPDMPGKMQQALEKQNFNLQEMQEIGLVKNGYEMFRGRVIFPITDGKGRVIAFGGRILSSGEPKYLNSPETPIFQKRRVLFGKAIAKKPAYEAGNIIVTEGYMDVIALNQAGFKNAVAPLGTSLTDEHLQELWVLAKEPSMCFDGDNAGKRAMSRAAELALQYLKPGYSLKFVPLPEGQDPDDMVRADKQRFAALLQQARPLSEIIYEAELGRSAVTTPEQQADLRQRLDIISNKIPNKTIARNYQDFFGQRLFQDFRKFAGNKAKIDRSAKVISMIGISAPHERKLQLECAILGVIIAHPRLLNDANIEEDFVKLEFSHLEIDKMREDILSNSATKVDDNEPDSPPRIINTADINEKLASYVNQGVDYAKKSATATAAWESVIAQYHFEQAENDFKNPDGTEDFEKLQEQFKQLLENRTKINASFGD